MLIFASCSGDRDFTGSYALSSGPCRTRYIRLTKVKGFADKYYVVTLIEGNSSSRGKEFLGVVNENIILVDNGIITVKNGLLEVKSGNRICLYRKD